MEIDRPSPERIEELVAQVEYQGGGDYVRMCQPRRVMIPPHQLPRSEEAAEDPKPRATVPAAAQAIETCSCGQAAKVEISYRRPGRGAGTYTACAVCDAVHRQPRFDGDPNSVDRPVPGTEEAA